MLFKNLDDARWSILVTLNEIDQTEHNLRQSGIDVRDPSEWMQVRDIIARIERRLRAGKP